VQSPENWQRVKRIIGAALERSSVHRQAFLDDVCAGDSELRSEVDSLLSAYGSSDDLSKSPLNDHFVNTIEISRSLGPYVLLEKLGEGGMGQVWLAEQTAPVRRRAALKLIRSGFYDDVALRRFKAERQSLAIMDHPAIAKVFEAGVTPEGQPFFAMEYVPGVSITRYCDNNKLSIRNRLELFIRVCEGVQHAHQKAIIHRDLKPANILVVEVDGKATPRIIDFGLAKTVDPLATAEWNTQIGIFVGTPGYMSPEQADPRMLDIDTRTDVYSLGAVLYELLTGVLPFDVAQPGKLRLDEILRKLQEDDPLRPSAKVSSAADAAKPAAEARSTQPPQLVRDLDGDLDWITMRALEKDRDRRYGTPMELAADISRYLRNMPVLARPATRAHRARKYVQRHRIGVTVAAGAAVLLAGFAVVQAIQLRRITHERDRADRVADFMTDMFKVSDPSAARGNTITAREILDRAASKMDSSLANDPVLHANMMAVIGEVSASLGLYPRSRHLLENALQLRRTTSGPDSPETIKVMNSIGRLSLLEGQYSNAETWSRNTHALAVRKLGAKNPDTLNALSNLAKALRYEGKYEEAEKLARQGLAISSANSGSQDPTSLQLLDELALIESNRGRMAEAEKLFRQELDIESRVAGFDEPRTLMLMNNLGANLADQKRFAEAEQIQRAMLDIERRVLGPDHPETLASTGNLANYLLNQGRFADAEKIYRETLLIQQRILPNHPDTLRTLGNLANLFADTGRYAEAESLKRDLLAKFRLTYGDHHPETAGAAYDLACVLARQGRSAEALSFLRQSVEIGLHAKTGLDMDSDSDLSSLHANAQFQAIAAIARAQANSQKRTPNPEPQPHSTAAQ
jgi:non-specific serine/threonine protein kinase/serine/threonine-protein kinase